MNTFWSYVIILLIGLAGGLVLFGIATLLVFVAERVYRGVRALLRFGKRGDRAQTWLPEEEAQRQHEDEVALADAEAEEPPAPDTHPLIVPGRQATQRMRGKMVTLNDLAVDESHERLGGSVTESAQPVVLPEELPVVAAVHDAETQDDRAVELAQVRADADDVDAREPLKEAPSAQQDAVVDSATFPAAEPVTMADAKQPESTTEPESESEAAPTATSQSVVTSKRSRFGRFPQTRVEEPPVAPQEPAEDPLAELKRRLAGK